MHWLLLFALCLNPDSFDLHADSPEVERWKHFLLEVRKKQTKIALENARTYVPLLRPIFQEEGVPDDLLWLAMIESSFRPDAHSPTGAGGMFQFKAATARILGLQVKHDRDERMVPEKAARAAAKYLSYLRRRFESWDLVLAAYNLGEGDLRRAMRAHGADEWDEIRPFIREETQNYVGKVKAAALIGNSHLEGLIDEEVPVPIETDLAIDVVSAGDGVAPAPTQLTEPLDPPAVESDTYTVQKGDTLWSIARSHGLTLQQLKQRNRMHNHHIHTGQVLRLR